MRVLFDLSVPGTAHFFPRARTGVNRIIEELLVRLVTFKDIELAFRSLEHHIFVAQSVRYLESSLQLRDRPFLYSGSDFYDGLIRSVGRRFPESADSASNEAGTAVHASLRGRAVKAVLAALIKLSTNRFYDAGHDPCDIYHSPFHPLPRRLHALKTVRRFTTICDLIPILFPQYFEERESEYLRTIVANVTPEDWYLCISEASRNDFLNHATNADPERVLVVYPAAGDHLGPQKDPQQFARVVQRYDLREGRPYFLGLSTLEPRKNIRRTIRSFAELIAAGDADEADLVLAGPRGWDFDSVFEELDAHAAVKDRVRLIGFVAEEDLAVLYSNALAFVFPSLYEGFGLPPLEAMRCGTPVIVTNRSSLPEVVGKAGVLIDPEDGAALSEAMRKMYADSEYRERLSRRSLEQAAQFSWERNAAETAAAYRRSLR